MPAVTGPFPYNIDNLLGGAARILRAPMTEDIPASIADVIDVEAPYAPLGDWEDVGATKESFTYGRGFETEGYEIQQVKGNVIEEVTDTTRTIEVSIAEFRPDLLSLIEGETIAPDATAVQAGENVQDRVRFGSIRSLNRYRWAFIARRDKASGIVTETGGATRGRLFMGVLYAAQLAADDIDLEMAKGALTAVGVSFTSFPESGQPDGGEYGAWFDERPGVIT
jgi:hypothetical protein